MFTIQETFVRGKSQILPLNPLTPRSDWHLTSPFIANEPSERRRSDGEAAAE